MMKMAHIAIFHRGFVDCCAGESSSVLKERNVNTQRRGALQCICSLGGRRCNSASEQLCNQGPIH